MSGEVGGVGRAATGARRSFAVRGMHCPACERLVADTLVEQGLARSASASLARREVEVAVADGPAGSGAGDGPWLKRARAALEPLGYRLLAPGEAPRAGLRETLGGLGIAVAVLGLFAALQASGVVHAVAPTQLDVGGAVLLGVVASLSSCFALVGGLLVTYTSALARTDQAAAWAGQSLFHASRLVTFVLLGAGLGALGGAFALDLAWTQALQGLAVLVMLGLGLQLLGVFAGLRLPGGGVGVTARARRWAASARLSSGVLLGVASFFLPCGFTQSMQFQALASASPAQGALLLGAFAVGTLPVLAGLSTALVKGFRGRGRELSARSAGFLVLGLGLYQAVSLLKATGLLRL